ncbi:MAG: MucR family transcriptional regulator [Pseudomonadota bacterium]
MAEDAAVEKSELLALASDIVASYVGNNTVQPDQVSDMLRSVYGTMTTLTEEKEEEQTELIPAVPIKKSVTNDYIICLEDGKQLKMLKRHLKTAYNMTPEDYREKWGLKPDYPMVAPSYAQKRQELAKKIGLGRKPRTTTTSSRSKSK